MRYLALLLILSSMPVPAHAAKPIRLTDGARGVVINPATLAARTVAGLVLSDAGPEQPVRDLVAAAGQARWYLPASGVSVEAALHADTLDVTFRPDRPGTFTFPRLGPSEQRRAFIVPAAEGVYVPARDAWWAAYLKDHGPEDTLEGLTMPFVGVNLGKHTATYIFTNRFHNRLEWDARGESVSLNVSHTTGARPPLREWTVRIVAGNGSPVEPARAYRRWLKDHDMFVTMREKIARAPETAKLLGAAQAYLWGGDILSRHDARDWSAFCRRLVATDAPPAVRRAWERLSSADGSPEAVKAVRAIAAGGWPDRYATGVIAAALSDLMARANFAEPPLPDDGSFAAKRDIAAQNSRAFAAAFKGLLLPPEQWGDGVSVKMMDRLAHAGITRLWLGLDSWDGALNHPAAIDRAKSLGWLVAPYDSYNSIHAPGAKDTWPTAQFDTDLWENGPVIRADGTKEPGFQKKGHILSARAAFPYVRKRVAGLMHSVPFNAWFLDTDSFGQLYDDYSPRHPGTQADDMRARLQRIAWIQNTFRIPVGSEGGSAYAAPALAYEQGVTVPTFGWGDADLKDRRSPYYLGAYYPPDGPAVFLKPVPLKEEYARAFQDPRYRIPLYETVFHDSVIATRHWSAGSLKLSNVAGVGELMDLLYQTPPLYHWNLDTFREQQHRVTDFLRVFSPTHLETGLLPMSDFTWLTADRRVQRARFGDVLEVTANFGNTVWNDKTTTLPPMTAEARWLKSGRRLRYTAPADEPNPRQAKQ